MRLDRNNLSLETIPAGLLTNSNVSLISYDGNRFDEKAFQGKEGYEQVSDQSPLSPFGHSKAFRFSSCSTWNASRRADENSNRLSSFFEAFFFLSYCTHIYLLLWLFSNQTILSYSRAVNYFLTRWCIDSLTKAHRRSRYENTTLTKPHIITLTDCLMSTLRKEHRISASLVLADWFWARDPVFNAADVTMAEEWTCYHLMRWILWDRTSLDWVSSFSPSQTCLSVGNSTRFLLLRFHFMSLPWLNE